MTATDREPSAALVAEEVGGREPGYLHALLCFGGVLLIVIVGVAFSEIEIHLLLLADLLWVALNAAVLGHSFKSIKRHMNAGLARGFAAIYIFVLIGVVIAGLIEAGTLATLVYHALSFVAPSWFLAATLLICSLMSLATGTSWGTVGTVGVVLVGIGTVLGVPPPMVAGAVVSGAIFGDKMSPLSDTTILASSCAGTEVYNHIRSMTLTTGPAYLATLLVFVVLGLRYSGLAIPSAEILVVQAALAEQFSIELVTLTPLIAILLLSLCRVAAEPAMIAGSLLAVGCALTVQGSDLQTVLTSLQYGHEGESSVESVNLLLNRGGIQSMMWSLSLCLIALALGGLLSGTGMLRVALSRVVDRLDSVAKLVATTIVTCIVSNVAMAENYLSIVFGSQLFREPFQKAGLRRRMLSRSVEEGATLTAGLIPWTSAGAFMSSTLGVATLDYAPWVLLSYFNVLGSIAMASLGIAVLRADAAAPFAPR
jgi:NhaC family Na+:H+ antiporter